ncbi:MAG: hypothetical protein HZB41_09820, partial [Ignavibacteriae bacterium]|nr:hypothetical protein [Ignavibacteriota bacterium]
MKCIIIFFIIIYTNVYCNSNNIIWNKVFDDDTLLFLGIDNADTNYAMALADISGPWRAVLKTTDAGNTWFYVLKDSVIFDVPWPSDPQDISYPTRDFCIIGCDSNYFLKTTDGGITWYEYKIDIPYSLFGFRDIDMYDENHGVMKSSLYLAVSHDGFKNWDTISNPGGDLIFNVEMAAPYSICVLSRDIDGSPDFNERFFRSDDGGKTWDEYPHPDYRVPKALQFVDSLVGYEVGGKLTGHGQQQHELVYKTSDGGRSWEKVLDTIIYISFGLQKLDFYDKDNGIVVGQFGAVFWTHDGGKSWTFDSSSVIYYKNPATMNVCYIRQDRAIIADFLGRIFISEDTTIDVVEEIPSGDDFVIYPNPASDKIKIKLK